MCMFASFSVHACVVGRFVTGHHHGVTSDRFHMWYQFHVIELSNTISFRSFNSIWSCIFNELKKVKHQAHTWAKTLTHNISVLQQKHYHCAIISTINSLTAFFISVVIILISANVWVSTTLRLLYASTTWIYQADYIIQPYKKNNKFKCNIFFILY